MDRNHLKNEKIFQTARKGKLPKGMSYPIGAEILSHAFRAIPQFSEIVLDFYCPVKNKNNEIPLMTVEYNPNGIGFNLENKWCIAVCATQSELKISIRRILEEEGFVRIVKWLVQSRPESWFDNWKRLIIYFKPKDETLLYKEDGRL